MKNKNLVLAVLFAISAFGMAIQSFAATRNRYMVPVNQNGITDSYALPCTVVRSTTSTTGTTYGTRALDEAGAVYWLNLEAAATAGDYVVLRDSATANTSSTVGLRIANSATTASLFVRFNPPIAMINGLSVDVSTPAIGVTVCVREADGDL